MPDLVLPLVIPHQPQKNIIKIVSGLAERMEDISMSKEELLAEANKWELSHGGRSGRTAQQFINYLAGQEKKA